MSDAAIELGTNIRRLRTTLGISQEELAFKASISPAHLGQIERAVKKPTVDTIDKIAAALDVSISELFDFESCSNKGDQTVTFNKIVATVSSMNEEEQKDILKVIRTIKNFKERT